MAEAMKNAPDQDAHLTAEQRRILREKGTEPAFTGEYWDTHTPGVYACRGCGAELFDASVKYESGTGWPSFWQPLAADRVRLIEDSSHGMRRTEVVCARCGGHLGHRFDDGPKPTGQRFCMNSGALQLRPESKHK